MPGTAVRFSGITRRFPGVLALHDVSFEAAAGSCHAVCGENGAGKSTLGRILAGVHAPDAGTVYLAGEPVRFRSPRDAFAAGVAMVHQERAFCEQLSVAENLCLGSLPSRWSLVRRDELVRRAESMLAAIGTRIDPRAPLGTLAVAQQQLVQIAAAVSAGARVIVFDEPTSSLGDAEADQLLQLIRRLADRGVTCLYVSHRLSEVFRLCDTVTVLRDGEHVTTRPIAGLGESELAELMIGRPLAEYFPDHGAAPPGDELLRVEGLSRAGAFQDISFTVRAGEIVGLAGLVGAGRSEVAQAIFGVAPPDAGRVLVNGREAGITRPADAIALGLGLVPEDRARQGLLPAGGAVPNVSLPVLDRLARFGWLRRGEELARARDHCGRLRVRAADLDAPVAGLSGGNQQKVVLARWLAARSRVLIQIGRASCRERV